MRPSDESPVIHVSLRLDELVELEVAVINVWSALGLKSGDDLGAVVERAERAEPELGARLRSLLEAHRKISNAVRRGTR